MNLLRVAGALAPLILVTSLQAASTCGTGTLSGTYLYKIEGFSYKAGGTYNSTSAADPFVAAGRLILNGAGGGTVTQTIVSEHKSVERTFPVTYQVLPNCQGSIALQLCEGGEACTSDAQLAIAPNGGEAFAVSGRQGLTVSGEFKKVSSGGCSAYPLSGDYHFQTRGFGMKKGLAPAAATLAFTSAGIATVAGDQFSAQDWFNLGGFAAPRDFGTYTLTRTASCTFELAGAARIYAASDGSVFVLAQTEASGIEGGAPIVGRYLKQQ